MSWEEEALKLYERNSSESGIIRKSGNDSCVLLPPYHISKSAQIEIVIDADGNFLAASRVSDEDKFTIIPVTEKSGARTRGKEPHPLCDKLSLLAGDYSRYVKEKADEWGRYHALYLKALEAWYLSRYTHDKVRAIYCYVKKGEVTKDLINTGVLVVNDKNFLDKTFKIQKEEVEKALVRFVVRQKRTDEVIEEKCWKDRSLQMSFIEYVRSQQTRKTLDYLTGQQETPSYLHPKGIRYEGDPTKLISSNDGRNFTFRGRFLDKEQAFAIGYENSQKIHNALKWIIRKQGRSFDTLTIVAWESEGMGMPSWDADTAGISSEFEKAEKREFTVEAVEGVVFVDDFQESFDSKKIDTVEADANPMTAETFYQALNGYRRKVKFTSKMILLAFEAVSKGRLALVEYKTLDSARYLENIEKWHTQCQWMQRKEKGRSYYGVPGVHEIADILYGSEVKVTDRISKKIKKEQELYCGAEEKETLTIAGKNRKKLYAALCKRLLPCIWDGRRLPEDLVLQAVQRASSPQGYKNSSNWESVLSLACSFVKKSRYDRKGEEFDVALNKECNDRNYLYGRLLAVADKIEHAAFSQDGEIDKVTNAKRYMSTFAQRPFTTWKIIEENAQPYLNKLEARKRCFYEKLLDEIYALFDVESFQDNTKLDGLYLLGFHSQSLTLSYRKNKETESEAATE